MAFKILIIAMLAAHAYGSPVAPVYAPAPVAYAPVPVAYGAAPAVAKVASAPLLTKQVVSDDYDPNPQYSYGYDIQDHLTGDSKNHQETRNGDVVQGSYSLIDPDGVKRTVEYTSDPHNGFNAIVHREPLGAAVKVAPAVAKVAPVAYAQPVVAKAAFAQPTQVYASQPAYYHH